MDFDKLAKDFDTDRRKERAKEIAGYIKQYIDSKCHSAMEFGCGTGLIGLELINLFSNITFIDSSQKMIDEVNRKIFGFTDAIAIPIDLLKENLPDKKFDFIFTSMVLHHIKNTKEILTILYNLLNKNGKLIIVDLNKNDGGFHMSEPDFDGHNGFEQEQIYTLLDKTGFNEIEIKTIYQDSKVINGESIAYSLFISKAVKSNQVVKM